MANGTTAFPAALDTIDVSTPADTDYLVGNGTTTTAGQIVRDMKAEFQAVQTKVGITNSADTSSLTYQVNQNSTKMVTTYTTVTTSSFTMPANGTGATASFNVANAGQIQKYVRIYVQNAGFLFVTAVSGTTLTVVLMGDTIGNTATGSTVPVGSNVAVQNDFHGEMFTVFQEDFTKNVNFGANSYNSAVSVPGTAQVDHPGIFQMFTGVATTNNGQAGLSHADRAFSFGSTIRWGARMIFYNAVPLNTTEAGYWIFGLVDTDFNNLATANGMYIIFRPSVNSTKMQLVASTGGTLTTSLSGGNAPTAGTWTEIRMNYDGPSGQLTASSGAPYGTMTAFASAITTGFPSFTNTGFRFVTGIAKTAGVTNVSCDLSVDLIEIVNCTTIFKRWQGPSLLV